MNDPTVLKQTPLHDLHLSLDARMVPFAGYEMPVQYPAGVMNEHLHTRASAGLFDVSHMGQIVIRAKSGRIEDAALALETLVPVDVLGLATGRQRYGLFTSNDGGILDDLMIANRSDHLLLVVNAACKQADFNHLRSHLGEICAVEMLEDRALLALQGPRAENVLAELGADIAAMRFMDIRDALLHDVSCVISRSGYTGEDGFEISMTAEAATDVANRILVHPDVLPIGLGARDSLRLEAGLCLYGNDMDEETTPAEAALGWAIQKVRRSGGLRAGGFPGAAKILEQLEVVAARRRVGLKPVGKAPVRGGALLFADLEGKDRIGTVTSGGFAPSLDHPVAMGFVETGYAAVGTTVFAEVRGKFLPVTVAALPFVANTFKR